jgi:hypothetical protein
MAPELKLEGSILKVIVREPTGASRWSFYDLNQVLANVNGSFSRPGRGWFDNCDQRSVCLKKESSYTYYLIADLWNHQNGTFIHNSYELHDMILSLQEKLGFESTRGPYKCITPMNVN